jgi:hypothetical protein
MTHPILTKTIINIVIYLLGDWMSQVSLLEFNATCFPMLVWCMEWCGFGCWCRA